MELSHRVSEGFQMIGGAQPHLTSLSRNPPPFSEETPPVSSPLNPLQLPTFLQMPVC